MPDRETLLEIGLFGALGFVLAGLTLLSAGALVGGARRASRRQRPIPSPGTVPHERHQHIAAVSAR